MVENKTNKHIAVFSGQNLNYDAQEFNGAKLTAVFGGIDLDLTNAKIQNDAEIRICAIFGGVDMTHKNNKDAEQCGKVVLHLFFVL